jgi:hypothetical protein
MPEPSSVMVAQPWAGPGFAPEYHVLKSALYADVSITSAAPAIA